MRSVEFLIWLNIIFTIVVSVGMAVGMVFLLIWMYNNMVV